VVNKILENKSETFGFDAQTEEYGDMLEKGIVDRPRSCARHCKMQPPSPAFWSRRSHGRRDAERAIGNAGDAARGGAWAEWADGFLIALPIVNPKGAVQTAPFFLLPWRRAA